MADTERLQQAWPEIRSSLAAVVGERARGMLEMLHPAGLIGSTAVLSTGMESTKDYVEQNLADALTSEISQHIGSPVHLALSVDPSLNSMEPMDSMNPAVDSVINITERRTAAGHAPQHAGAATSVAPVGFPRSEPQPGWHPGPQHGGPISGSQQMREPAPPNPNGNGGGQRRGGLNPKYTFDSFVRGTANMLAHAAANAVAEQPAVSYNPLVIHGDSGLGKTHLLHAIGWYTQQMYPESVIRYVTSEEFTNEFVNSIQHDRGTVFKDRYRKVDLLLVDDIQFMSGKEQTQEEFFHTFNTLHQAQKQIVVTSDVAPSKIPNFMNRLSSRFEWGLLADVQVPDLETRMAIVRKKAAQDGVQIPADAVEYIASRITTNIRELEGSLTRVTAYANLNRSPIDLPMVQDVLRDLVSVSARPEVTVAHIMDETAAFYGVTVDDLQGASRTRHLSTARQVAIYIAREITELSLPKIGEAFGGRDHTTVMHAERKINRLMKDDRNIYNQVNELTMRIRSSART